ncbi:MAG: hypothetical protein ACREA9_22000 [Pyrinomonadaceae bacterium]
MLVYQKLGEAEEVERWLRELWQGGIFTASPPRKRFAGAYTLYCSIVQYKEMDYILKRYNPLGVDGIQAEKANYLLFGEHAMFPRLEAFLPKGTETLKSMSYGVLISYYSQEVSPSGISLAEVLAIGLAMATMFTYFVEKCRIYFDLRSDSLRLDSAGGLHLIDFSDLITTEDLLSRSYAGLPVVDRKSKFIPPEGTSYQGIYEDSLGDKAPWSAVRKAAHLINPERYQVFSLAGLITELLVGFVPGDTALSARIDGADQVNDGSFTASERNQLLDLLIRMQDPNDTNRPALKEVRELSWSLLSSRLTYEGITSNRASMRAAKLLQTIPRREDDSTSLAIHQSLEPYWSTL